MICWSLKFRNEFRTPRLRLHAHYYIKYDDIPKCTRVYVVCIRKLILGMRKICDKEPQSLNSWRSSQFQRSDVIVCDDHVLGIFAKRVWGNRPI